MSTYSIRDLERITSTRAHTIRIWEQRYGLLEPERTDTNIRYYNDDHVKKTPECVHAAEPGHEDFSYQPAQQCADYQRD